MGGAASPGNGPRGSQVCVALVGGGPPLTRRAPGGRWSCHCSIKNHKHHNPELEPPRSFSPPPPTSVQRKLQVGINRTQEVDSASPGSFLNHSRSPTEEEKTARKRTRRSKVSRRLFLTEICSLFSSSWMNSSVWCSGVAFRNTSSTAPSSCTHTHGRRKRGGGQRQRRRTRQRRVGDDVAH